MRDAHHPHTASQPRDDRSARVARTHDLPAQPSPLIGRDHELAALTEHLQRAEVRLLTLTGPGGTGKTRLALELAAQQQHAFEHGSVFVDLAHVRDPGLVVSAFATALGLLDAGRQPLLDKLKLFVRDRQLLVVLDNFEHLLAAAPLLPDFLQASTRMKLIVTSRAALRLWRWEHEFPVTPLALPDPRAAQSLQTLEQVASVALFVDRAQARRPAFRVNAQNADAIAEICVRLDGLPLALELAAAGVKLLSPRDILARLEARLELPVEPGGDFPTRHHTLRGAVGWSYDLLSASEQALLRRLSVFAGGFSLAAAQAICSEEDAPGSDLLPVLAQLVDHSLVVAEERGGDTRYRLLETIREFAGQQLESSGEAHHYRWRHAEWCVQLGAHAEAELRGRSQSAWLDRLELEHDNLRAGLGWLSESERDAVDGLRLAAALWQFWWLRGYLSEGRQQIERILARAGPPASTIEWVKVLLAAGALAFRQGDYAAARRHLEGSLAGARALGNPAASAVALRNLGRMAIDRAEFADAHKLLDESLSIDRGLANTSGTAWSLNYLGLLGHFEGDNSTARLLLEQSLPIMRDLEDRWGTAVALAYLGRVEFEHGNTTAAAAAWTESLDICRTHAYFWCVQYLLDFFAGLAVAHGQPLRGLRLAGAAESLFETIGAPLPKVWRASVNRDVAAARQAVGVAPANAAWAEGRALSLDEAAAEARAATQPSTPRAALAPIPEEPPETRYAKSGSVNIAYQVVGQGPLDLVFVMGWVSHLDFYWREPRFARFLRRLGSFARVILFDKRGTGLSDRGVGLPTLEERMDDLRAVLDAVGCQRAAVLGVSEGGAMCSLFAATYPERTSALVLIGCIPRRMWAPDYPWGLSEEQREAQLTLMERDWASPPWVVRDLERRAPSVASDERFARWWATYSRMSASPGAAVALARMNNQIDIRPVVAAIHVPTLVIHRTGDRTINVEAGRYLAGHIPDAQYLELPGDDHLPFVGDQDAILDAAEEFLTGIRPAAVPDRVLKTVLAMELVNATATAASVGEARWRDIEAVHADIVRDQVQRHRGATDVAAAGGLLATFDGPARAVLCGLAIVDESRSVGLELRAGLHTGECDVLAGLVEGTAFRIASWAMARAGSGQVLASSTVRDLLAGSGIEFDQRPLELEAPDGLGLWRLFVVGANTTGRRRAEAPPAKAAHAASPAASASVLTQREREVAVLLARGLTNRQIGELLVVSPTTAERHVLNIFNKLGFHSRSQVAAWVVEQGLGASAG